MTPSAQYVNQPFEQAIQFFRGKVSLPTETWKDLWQGMHARAFVIAGATKGDLLADMRGAVDKAIAQGTTLEEFRADFDAIVGRHGWQYKGGRAWRTAVIYNTNLSTAYAAGHYQAMTDPAVLAARPYWRYVASSAAEPRPEHMQWYNTVLPADDPWWRTHYPPNGWGCKCGVVAMSGREVERLKGAGEEIRTQAPEDGTYQWTDKATGVVHTIPKGIDPGWDYNVGNAAWGQKLADETWQAWQAQGKEAWEILTPGDWQTAGRQKVLAPDVPVASIGPKLVTEDEMVTAITEINGGTAEKLYQPPAGPGVMIDAKALAAHLDPERSPFLPLLPEALENPQEIWIAFERHKGSGRVELKQRIIKVMRTDKDRAMVVAAQVKGGFLEAWTMVPTSKWNYVNNQRVGKLLWARD